MAIYRKEHIDPYLRELEAYYQAVRRALEGDKPDPAKADLFHYTPERFADEFTEIDVNRLQRELAHFKAATDGIKQIKQLAQRPYRKP